MAAPPGLRERKKLQRRKLIEDTALELFARDGFDATTVETIAAACDIAPRTFFSYFPTKDDLVLADYAERLARILDAFAARPANEPVWQALQGSFEAIAADYESEADRLRARFAIMATAPSVRARSLELQLGWEFALVERLSERDDVVDDTVAQLLAGTALAIMRAALRQWFTSGTDSHPPELMRRGFALAGNGFDHL
jgi:AcrR family transcriptional regulator